jgi:hypothetical protein
MKSVLSVCASGLVTTTNAFQAFATGYPDFSMDHTLVPLGIGLEEVNLTD